MGSSNKHQEFIVNQDIERLIPQQIPWYKKRLIAEHEMRYKFALAHIQNKVVLDIACGSGFGSSILSVKAKKVYAIDSDPMAIRYAKKKYSNKNINFEVGDAQKIKIQSNTIDVTVSFETIEHLKSPKNFLKEINRILKPSGILILSTPNKQFSHGDNPYHLKEFTLAELKQLLLQFKSITCYGQRPINISLFLLYKNLEQVFPFAKSFFRFRPWEKISIEKINQHANYLYLIVICQK